MARGSAEILHQRQESIISRIETLESTLFSHHRSNGNDVPADDSHGRDLAPAIADALQSINVHSFKLHRVPQHYYDVSLEERKQMLGAPSTYHLTKSVVMTNTKHPPGSQNSSRELGKSPYVMVVVQYEAKLDATKKVKRRFIEHAGTSNNSTNMRLAPEETAQELVGMGHNAMTPILPVMNADMPIIASHRIFELNPPMLFLGGGFPDVKLSMSLEDFKHTCNPYILDITAD